MPNDRRIALPVCMGLLLACGSSAVSGGGDGDRYANDASYRRAELVASLVNPSNAYSELRLAHYAGGDGAWDALPEWNPRVEPVLPRELADGTAGRAPLSAAAAPLATDSSIDDEPAMVALGEAAFFGYPTQLSRYASVALVSPAAAKAYGLWVDDARGQVGGLVRAEMGDGSAALALTCASCHAAAATKGLVVGVGSDTLDLGRMIADANNEPSSGNSLLLWGRGRVDVTTMNGDAPERIPDVRPVRWLTHLHQEATILQRDQATLAIRIETLIITSHGQTLRPPRIVAWALSTYLRSLVDTLPPLPSAGGAHTHGAEVFASHCTSCHREPGLTGPPVALDVVGTDPEIGLSTDRGTGTYRVPSLHGVGTRGLLLHDASLPSLAAMFDPSRTDASFNGGTRGPGAVQGHLFGLDLPQADRAALVAFLGTL